MLFAMIQLQPPTLLFLIRMFLVINPKICARWGFILGGNVSGKIIVEKYGNVYSAGKFKSNHEFDAGACNSSLISHDAWDADIAKFDSNCNYLWSSGIVGSGDNAVTTLPKDTSSNVTVIGRFKGEVDFNRGTDVVSGIQQVTH